MKNLDRVIIAFLLIVITLFSVTQSQIVEAESKYTDGEYSLPFTVLKGDSDNPSMTNDYLTSPAKLIVKDGKNFVQATLKNSSWWQEFSVASSGVTVISEANDTRVVQFEVGDLDQILHANIHVIVPDINYDNKYDVRFKFDTSDLTSAVGIQTQATNNGTETTNQNAHEKTTAEKNPPTGDHTPIILLSVAIIFSGLILVRKLAIR
jgi:heme-binding NEAT domain protein